MIGHSANGVEKSGFVEKYIESSFALKYVPDKLGIKYERKNKRHTC